jgi:TonB-linked SusC/RagA family outer membrane protein
MLCSVTRGARQLAVFVMVAVLGAFVPRLAAGQEDSRAFIERGPRFLYASNGNARPGPVDVARTPVLRHRLSVDFDAVPLGEALKRIAQQSGLELAFSNAVLRLDKPVQLKATDITVAAALTELLIDADVDVLFSRSGQAVLIRRTIEPRKSPPPVTGSIAGRVIDQVAGLPVAGVAVVITGTNLSAMTREDGRYMFRAVPVGTYALQARRLGYAPITRSNVVVVDGQTTTVDFTVQAAALSLQETVVTGVVDPTAGTKVPFTVGRVTKDEVPVPPTNAITTIQGKVAGVMMVPPAQPGSEVSIQLRTPTSINKNNAPLIVVDGVILASSSPDLNALDIESIEVVKGAAGASLYGSRAANGVIQIRTSRGNGLGLGETQFTVRSEVGSSSLGHEVEFGRYHYYLTNPAGDYVNAAGTVVTRNQRVPRPAASRFQDVPYNVPLYDPVDQFFDPGKLTTNSLTVAQNGEKTNFLTTLSNQQQDGVVLGHGGYERTDVRINLDHRPRDDFQLSVSGYHARSDREELPGDPFYALINIAPDANLLTPDPDGTKYAFQPDPLGVNANPLYLLETQKTKTQRVRTLGSAALRYTPLAWLSIDANASYDRADQNGSNFINRGIKTPTAPLGSPGFLTLTNEFTSAVNADASASLLQQFGALVARATFRVAIEDQTTRIDTASGTNFAVAGVPRLNAALSRNSASAEYDWGSQAYFASAGLDYDSRFIVDGLLRRDASSLFGPGEQWHTYYRGSAAWRIAQEPWWRWKRINEFKLRVSQGTAGTRPSFADQYETYTVAANGTVTKAALGNRFLKPETARETEVGVDIIVDNRFSLQVSRAATRTTDELIEIPLPASVGFVTQWQNAGTVVGNTWEATLEAEILRRGTTSWKLGVVADRSRNHIAKFERSCVRTASISYRCVGEDLSTMYGLQFLHSPSQLPASQANAQGVFEVNDDGLLVAVGQGGHYTDPGKWGTTVVSNGVTYQWGMPIVRLDSTGQQAVVRIGSGNPKLHYGISNSVQWKGFQFYGLLDTQVGGNIYNATNQRMYQYQRSADVDQAGKPEALKKPIDYYSLLYNGNNVVDWFVEPGGFVKLRELSVSYNVPKRLLSRLSGGRATGATLSVLGRNLMTWTDYSGYDPEVGTVTNRLGGFDYPQYRSFTGVLQLQF